MRADDLRLRLRELTPARVALGRAGCSIPTAELLAFQLAHARARDAVHLPMDVADLAIQLQARNLDYVALHSAAPDRAVYLRRPDLGRTLDEASRERLRPGRYDAAFVIADGLSALAVHRHAVALVEGVLAQVSGWRVAPIAIVEQGRVAIGDEIGERLGAEVVAVLIGERPGLSSPDSLGVYLTFGPRRGRNDAERNCVSNIHEHGLDYQTAARKLVFLMREARRRKLSGVALKEDFSSLPSS